MLQISSFSGVFKQLLLLLVAATLSSCASAPPKDPNNICTILSENKGWYSVTAKASKRWGLPPHIGLAFIHRESSFVANAKPPREKYWVSCPGVAHQVPMAMPRPLTKPGKIIKKTPGGDLYKEMTLLTP